RRALQLINQALDEVLVEQESEFDPDTRFAVAWYEQYGLQPGPFGDAETLSKAKNVALQGLLEAGIGESRPNRVRLLSREELDGSWDPRGDARLTVWEATQHLVRSLDEKGEAGAADLLRLLGGLAETARELAYRLHDLSDRGGLAA